MKDTKIEWADHSWSPWIGCTKVSPGCANCYAEHLMDKRMKRVNWGKGNPRMRTSPQHWMEPLKWNRDFVLNYGPELLQPPITVFPSLCDWLDPEVPIEWLADFLALIHRTPNLRWLLLTKRPENWKLRIDHAIPYMTGGTTWAAQWLAGIPPQNLAVGISAEDQQRWDERVPALLKIPARLRFVSVEPMLGPINLQFARRASMRLDDHSRQLHASIDQVIFGGESGPGARPCNVDWIRDGVRQCREAGVKAFVKQLGSRPSRGDGDEPFERIRYRKLHGAGHHESVPYHPKGGDPSEWPEDLRVREEMV